MSSSRPPDFSVRATPRYKFAAMMSKRLLLSAVVFTCVGVSCGGDQVDIARPFLNADPARLEFEGASDMRTLRLTNSGRARLTVSRIEVVGAPEGVFLPAAEVPFNIAGGESRDIEVTFRPQQQGITQGVLRIRSNADNSPERDVALSGRNGDLPQPDGGTTEPDAGTEPDGGTDTPDAGTEEPDAGEPDAGTPDAGEPDAGEPDAGEPDAGTDEPDAGTPDAGEPDAGTDEPDAGTVDPGGACTIHVSDVREAGTTSDSVNDLALATGGGKTVVGWWTDKRSLQVRELDSGGVPTGVVRSVFSGTASNPRYPQEYLAAAGDERGVVFFVSEESNFNTKVHQVDLRGATPAAAQLDLLTLNQRPASMAATTSRGGIVGLWRQNAQFTETSYPHELVGLRLDGAAPFGLKRLLTLQRTDTTKNPNVHSAQFTAAPRGDELVVAWHGQVGSISPISVARLDADGALVDGSVKLVSNGGTGSDNVLPQIVSTNAGLAVAWSRSSASVRRAVVAELDEALDSRGDIDLGELGPTSVTAGSVAAAAQGDIVLVGWTRYTASGSSPVKQGLSFSGIDRRTGQVLAKIDLSRTAISTYGDYLAITPSGAGWIATWAETGGKVAVARVTCEE